MNNNYHQEQIEEFKKINPTSIKNHIFQDLELEAYCYNIHDTDTISILFKYKDEIIKYNIRISGIDAPELNSKILYERELCIKGTQYLKNLILNNILKVKIKKIDKYGRLLADLYTLDLYPNNIYINKDLIDKGYCREYNGDAKVDWNLVNSDNLINGSSDNAQNNIIDNTQHNIEDNILDNAQNNIVDNAQNNIVDNTTNLNINTARVKRKYVKKIKTNNTII
jgi:endonuclease YncB( thermonuclease family)